MPRKQPPPGYITAGEAARMLQVTDAMLTIYVRQGKLKRYGPETRKHKFYKLSEVEKLAQAERAFFEPDAEVVLPSESLVFCKTTLADLEAEGYLAYLCFGPRASDTMPARRAFLAHNPDMSYHLYDHGNLAASMNILPLKAKAIEEFKEGKRGWLFSLGEIEQFTPGPHRLIIIDFMTAPVEIPERRRIYGAQLLMGLSQQLKEWGAQGVEILSVYACGSTESGRHSLRSAGFTELGEPVPGRVIFELDVTSSSLKLLQPYKEAFAAWQREQGK